MPRFYISASTLTSQNQGGGSKKKGSPSTIGLGQFSINNIKKRAGSCSCVLCPINEIIIPPDTHFATQSQLDILKGVTKIIGNFYIKDFIGQPDFSVFNCLKEVTGFFYIRDNAELATISDFGALKTVGEFFYINDNEKLVTISDFGVLETVGRYFNISDNANLATISYFGALKTVKEYFNISANGAAENTHVIINPIAFAKITIPGGLVTLAGVNINHQLHLQKTLITALNWGGVDNGAAPAFVLGL